MRFTITEINASELAAQRVTLEAQLGAALLDLHVQDATNTLHPSYFDTGAGYEMLIFRRLVSPSMEPSAALNRSGATMHSSKQAPRLPSLHTTAVTLFISPKALLVVSHEPNCTAPEHTTGSASAEPAEHALRLLNKWVDAYLNVRAPLTDTLDFWQKALLDPRRHFDDWTMLLQSREQLRKIVALAEEQIDALAEFKEHLLGEAQTAQTAHAAHAQSAQVQLRARANDVIEHIERVAKHCARLEASVESTLQIYFAAMSHKTNITIRRLTVMTAIFAPLTLITGFFGMNFGSMPWLQAQQGWLWSVWLMLGVAASVLLGFALTRAVTLPTWLAGYRRPKRNH